MSKHQCMWGNCPEDALDEPAAQIKLDGEHVHDLLLCQRHKTALYRGATVGISLVVKPEPARPAR